MRSDVQREYGGALWLLAAEQNCSQALLEDVHTLQTVLNENPDYIKLICSPDVHLDERLALLDKAFRGNVHAYLLNFLKLLAERGHFAFLPDCLDEYCRKYDEANHIENVTVYSAVELSDSQKDALRDKLTAKLQKTIRLHTIVDPSVIGGVRIVTENTSLDGTVRNKINTIRDNLLQTVI